MKWIFSVVCLCLVSGYALAQEEALVKLISFELGADGIIGTVPDHDYIRAETSYYGDEDRNLFGTACKAYAGVKGEVRSRNNKFGLSAGLRFTQINSSLSKNPFNFLASDFYYFMVAQTDNTIEYLKVNEIEEASNYIGVPISVNWSPFVERLFTFYFKGGLELTYRVSKKTTVTFINKEMNEFNDEVTDRLRDTQKLVSIFSTSAGIKIGQNPKVNFSAEIGPSIFMNSRTSSIVDVTAGFGGQLNLHLTL